MDCIMGGVAKKASGSQKGRVATKNTVLSRSDEGSSQPVGSPVERVFHLQQTIGNRGVTRLFQSGLLQARFKFGASLDQKDWAKTESLTDRTTPIVGRQIGAGNIHRYVQLSRLRDYYDTEPEHDPSHLTDAEIEATNEYRAYMNPVLVWQRRDHVTREEALLACRLLLRHMREGRPVDWEHGGRIFMNRAREQLGATGGVESLENQLEWVPFSSSTAVSDPSLLDSDFARWILAGEAEPDPSSGRLNCWEVILFGSYLSGYITESRIREIYNLAVENVRTGVYTSVGDTVERELKASNEYTFDPADPDSPAPLTGDMVVFDRAASHAAISTGIVLPPPYTNAGEHEILSLWTPNSRRVEKTTIEELLRNGAPTPVKFWSVNWN
jgi:hypothetical protein